MIIKILNTKIRQDKKGLFCINDIHKASGLGYHKKPSEWLRLKSTKELIDSLLSEQSGDSHSAKEFIKVNNGGANQGTYVCKELVYAYAMWINARFHLHVIRTFDKVTQEEYQRKATRELARVEYRPMTDALKNELESNGKEPKPYDFSNEANLINRLDLGMTASKFKDIHDIGKNEPIRDHLTPQQIKCITDFCSFLRLGYLHSINA